MENYPNYIPISITVSSLYPHQNLPLGDGLNPIKILLWMGLWHWLYHSWWLSHKNPLTPLHHLGTWLRERKTSRLLSRARKIICASRASEAWPCSATLMPYSKPHIPTDAHDLKSMDKDRQIWIWMSRPTFPQAFWVGYSCPSGINESKVPFKDVDSLEPSSKFIHLFLPQPAQIGRVSFCWPSKGLAPATQFHKNSPVHKLPKNHKHPWNAPEPSDT